MLIYKFLTIKQSNSSSHSMVKTALEDFDLFISMHPELREVKDMIQKFNWEEDTLSEAEVSRIITRAKSLMLKVCLKHL